MYSLRQYLDTLEDYHSLTRTLEGFRLVRDADNRPLYSVGNSAVIFPIEMQGRRYALRCYLRPHKRLKQIYGQELLPNELFIYRTAHTGEWVDVVLTEWREGETMQRVIEQAASAHDVATLADLSQRFDRLAASLLTEDWAHGDLKPENIIVAPDGELHLIDFDACFMPEMAGEPAIEVGTTAFQHPARTIYPFNARIDDYAATLISTALAALSLRPELYDRFGHRDGLLIDPKLIPSDEAYRQIVQLFAAEGLAVRYALARQLDNFHLSLPHAAQLFTLLGRDSLLDTTGKPSFYCHEQRYGLALDGQPVTPPLFDRAEPYCNGVAEVYLGNFRHRIDLQGNRV